MATLPGVSTIVKDRFYTLSRTDIPDGPRVAIVGRRDNDPLTAVPDRFYSDGSQVYTPQNYDPYNPRTERDVIEAYGEGSELHRGWLEAVSGGAARVSLVALAKTVTDADLLTTGESSPFEMAFGAVEAIQPDIVVPWGRGGHPNDWDGSATPADLPIGFYADNDSGVGNSLAKRVADKCAEISDRSYPLFAVMGVMPIDSATKHPTQTEVNTHVGFTGLTDRSATAFGDYGPYVSVISAEIETVGYKDEWGYSNGAALYAGFLSSIDAENASTGRLLFNVDSIRYNPTRPQQISMINKGVVPVALNFRRQAYVIDGLTFGRPESDFTRLSTLRITFDAIQLVRRVAQQYVGMPATLHHRNALETAISSALRGMMIGGALIDADFVVSYVPRENRAEIDLVLTPAFEMRNIDISISVQL